MLRKDEAGTFNPYLRMVKELESELRDSSKTCLGEDQQLKLMKEYDDTFEKNINQARKELLDKIVFPTTQDPKNEFVKQFQLKKDEFYFDSMTKTKDLSFKLFCKYSTELRLFNSMAQTQLVATLKLNKMALTDKEVLEFFGTLKSCYQELNTLSSAIYRRMSAIYDGSITPTTKPELLEFVSKSRAANNQDSPEYKLFKQITESSKDRKVTLSMKQFLENKSENPNLSPIVITKLKIMLKEIEEVNRATIQYNQAAVKWIDQNRLQAQHQEPLNVIHKSL